MINARAPLCFCSAASSVFCTLPKFAFILFYIDTRDKQGLRCPADCPAARPLASATVHTDARISWPVECKQKIRP